ncbi:MAG: hypothetical protein O2890_15920 [Cyanobacteria bacterium]|nr:hypothetical protein [Cyanobacteriota bacterium]MDA0867853.1 hypothetical protein [Cyanobacteriota bacterium]
MDKSPVGLGCERLLGLLVGVWGFMVACSGPPAAPPVAEEISTPASVPELSASTPVTAAPNSAIPPGASAEISWDDTQIIPGERFGPVTLETSRADLVAWLGAEALQDGPIPAGEGTTELGTRVDLGPEQSFSVIWVDDAQTRPLLVKDFGPAWQTSEGIGLGMPFAELQAVLGPFNFYGFGWDYGGTVVLAGTSRSDDDGLLVIRLQPDIDANGIPPESLQAVMGDRTFNSEDVNLADLGVTVGEMIVYLNPSP